MPNTNPQLYKIATQQIKVLRTLAKMSAQIGDREGAAIIQAAEVAIEHRIQITSMNLSALEYLEKLISQGHDYADAEWRTSQCYAIDSDELRTAYDNRPQPTTLSHRHKTLLEDIIAIADGMDVLDRGSREFEWSQQNLDRTIDKLDLWVAIDSPIPKLGYRFDSLDYPSCRELAAQLLDDCQ
ncbi:hypothetical protein [Chamaesiphon sp.]|uniref:hypothetical protein n=1 Tax=Chamaesiphon sp. TaxID=2814140 RepID=UPI0035931027